METTALTTAKPVATTDRHARLTARLPQSLPTVAAVIGLILVAVPIISTVIRSFYAGPFGHEQLSWANFISLVTDARLHEAAINTFIAGLGATIISVCLGTFLAWAVARTDMPGRRWFELLNLVPFFLSPYVGAMAWQYLAAPYSGMLGELFPFLKPLLRLVPITSIAGVVWVLALYYTPYIYLFVIGPMRNMDGALEDAARTHGASSLYTTRHITLPLLLPSILSGALIVFVTSAGLFDVPLVLTSENGIPTFPVQIYEAVSYPSNFGRAATLGTVMMVITIVFAVFQQYFLSRRRFNIISGKGLRPRTFHLPFGRAAATLSVQFVYILCSTILPVAAIILLSVVPIWTGAIKPSQFTLDNYRYVLFGFDLTQRAIRNSVFLAVAGASIGTALGFLQAYGVVRRIGPFTRFLEPILSLPLGIPGIILGLGFLVFLIKTPLYSTLWILLIAYVAHYTPFALRGMSAMFLALSPELEQSARASGASWWQTVRLILIPLTRPALIAIWLMLFVILIRELGASILLWSTGTETISVVLVTLSEQNFLYVAALAVIQLALLLSALVLFSKNGATILEH